MNKSLYKAYLATNYVADVEGVRVLIRIGEVCDALDEILSEKSLAEWAFITACNPLSNQLGVAENMERQNALRERLKSLGLSYFEGSGESLTNEWPPEPSLLVFGISPETAESLAKEFEQNAIVVGKLGGRAELVWVR